jgi:TRAP-type transport system periplasmic protein
MKNFRSTTFLAASAAIALGLTSCVGDDAEVENGDAGAAEEEELRFAHVYDPEHPVETCGVPAMNDSLDGSGLQISSYAAGQLGNEEELLEQVQSGALDLAVAGPSFLGVWEENAELFDATYLFSDVDHFEETLNGDIADDIWNDLRESSGMDVLSSWYYGTRQLTSDVEVTTSEDLSGQTLRVPEAPLYQTMAEILGGSPTSMALGEVYLGLQQGTIDGQENPIPTIASNSFQEVQDYINLTHHVIQGVMVVGNDDALSGLPEDQQQALSEAAAEAADDVRECIEDEEESYLEDWEESGEIEINDDVDIDHFRERAAERIPNEFEWGDIYLEIQEN